jgi:4-hydroxybenzoate polyprenyltransferase
VAGFDAGLISLQLGLAMLGIQMSIGLSNDAFDAEGDAQRKPSKPIPSGCLSRRAAFLGAAGAGALGLLLALWVGASTAGIGAAGLACGLVYNAYLKRTALSWVPLAAAMPLVLVWVLEATGEWRGVYGLLLGLAPLFALGVHLANQAPDVAAERGSEVRGLAHRLGARTALLVAAGLHGAASLGVAAVLGIDVGWWAGVLAVAAGSAGVAVPAAEAARGGYGRSFPAMAISTALVAAAALTAIEV